MQYHKMEPVEQSPDIITLPPGISTSPPGIPTPLGIPTLCVPTPLTIPTLSDGYTYPLGIPTSSEGTWDQRYLPLPHL